MLMFKPCYSTNILESTDRMVKEVNKDLMIFPKFAFCSIKKPSIAFGDKYTI